MATASPSQGKLRRRPLHGREARGVSEPVGMRVPPTVDLAAACLPAQPPGRDCYEFIDLGEGQVAVVVATSQGRSEAEVRQVARALDELRKSLPRHRDPAAALSEVNRTLARQASTADQFVAATCLVVDTRRGTARIVAAGAPEPLLRHLDGTVTPVEVLEPRFPLGMVPELRYEQQSVRLSLGETLLIASGAADMFEPLQAMIAELAGGSASELIAELSSAVDERQSTPEADPLALVALRWVARARRTTRRINLPAQLTSFVGRERELAELGSALRGLANGELLTLVGPGGTGKSRLALQLATDHRQDYPDGVFFVALAPLRDPKLVTVAIAEALGIQEPDDRPLLDSLKDYLRAKHLLLVLDNFEPVIDAAPLVADLLATAGQLEVVVTSRLPLQIPGEKAYAVPPLALPDPQQLPSLAMLSQAEAVALFIHRAQAVQPDFVVTEENAPAVAGLCAQVEGLPLALELAAARTRLLTPEAILQQLRQLRQEGQDIPVREQTLRAVIGWSYGLLPEPEQCLFRRLAVFVGGSTPEAAETVCGSALDLDMPDGVKTLVAASLVRQEAMADGKPRLLLPETIREYGQDQLTASEEAPEVERKHVAHYLDLAETAEPELHEEQQLVWLDRLEQEHDNLRAALRCAVEVEDAEMALRLCGALAWFWWIHGHLSEGRAWLAQALEVPAAQVKTAARAKALAASGFLARLQGDMAAARPHAEAGLAIYREVDDLRGRADALRTAGMALAVTGDLSKARELVAESLTLWRQEEDAHGIAHSLLSLGLVSQATGDDATAQACWEESVHFSRQLGDRFCLGVTLRELGRNAQARGDGRTAQELLAESLGLAREVGHEQGIAYARCGLADIVAAQGDYAEAGSLLQESLAAFRELADQAGIGRALEGFATLAALQHQPERALRLAGAATALHQTYEIAVPIPFQTTVERWLAPARQELSEADADAAWAEGRALSTERAFEYALSPVVEAASDAAS